MATEHVDKPAALVRLEAVHAHCERRSRRARDRWGRANEEMEAAGLALQDAADAVEAWKAANPDPQIALI